MNTLLGPLIIGAYGFWMLAFPKSFSELQSNLNFIKKKKDQPRIPLIRILGLITMSLSILLYIRLKDIS